MNIQSKEQSKAVINSYNILRHWDSIDEIYKCRFSGLVNIRDKRPSSRLFRYGIPANILADEIANMGVPADILYFNETAPDEFILIQGEVMQNQEHLELTYSFEKVSNRKALENPLFARGLTAKCLLEKYLDTASLEELYEIFLLYPGHVVEFSTFSIKLGSLARNTVIWEIRNY